MAKVNFQKVNEGLTLSSVTCRVLYLPTYSWDMNNSKIYYSYLQFQCWSALVPLVSPGLMRK